jgi:ABC-type lipoprotein release transport system permease subunit
MEMYTDVGYTIEETGEALSALISDAMQNRARIVIWSVLILLLSPLIWLFSQILFYGKREGELRILEAFGAYKEDIRNLHLWGGAVLAASAVVIALLEGVAASFIMFAVMNYLLPSIGVLSGLRYTFTIPVGGWISTAVASGLFAFISVMIPYLRYLQKRRREERASDLAYMGAMRESEKESKGG